MTLQEAQDAATSWVLARKDAIQDRVEAAIAEDPRKAHTAWVSSGQPNTDPIDATLATVTFDDPGRWIDTPCGSCYVPEGRFVDAGISIPATGKVNAKINIHKSKAGWGVQLVARIRYDGTKYERAWGRGIAPSFNWREVIDA